MNNAENARGCTYNSNNISIAKCPRDPKIVKEYDREIPQLQSAD